MANAKEHAMIGAGVGALGWFLYCKVVDRPIKFGELVAAGGVGMVGRLLPDLLEPALHPNHRQFFHSLAASALLVKANHHLWQSRLVPAEARGAVHLLSLGYLSHLAADGQTPKGLPPV